METTEFINEVSAIVGAEGVHEAKPIPEGWHEAPIAAAFPEHREQLAALVLLAERAGGIPLLPYGGATRLQTGYPPPSPALMVGMARLNRVLDYQPEDLTVTCEPGVTPADLQRLLSEHKQRLTLDVPLPFRSTLGGIVASGQSGIRRLTGGSVRDLLIGMKAVMTGGIEIKGGGRVVKNVAGYDLCKLFTGSWGTLGLLSELTFKVTALPDTTRAIVWPATDMASGARAALALHQEKLAASGLFLTNELFTGPHFVLLLEGAEERVDWQRREYTRLAAANGLLGDGIEVTEREIADWRDRLARLQDGIAAAARITCRPSDVEGILRGLPAEVIVTADAACGILWPAASHAELLSPETLMERLPATAHLVWTQLQGYENIERWGRLRPDFVLQKAIKNRLDPNGLFSPGRFVGRL